MLSKIKICIVLAVLLVTVPMFGRSYSTNFPSPPAPENPISEANNWLNGKANGLDWNNIKTSAGLAQTAQDPNTASGFDDGTALVSGTWGPDQCVQIVAKGPSSLGGVQEVEIRLRSSLSAGSSTGYEIDFTTGGTYIVRWNGRGPFTSTYGWTNITDGGAINFKYSNGNVLKACISGTVITIWAGTSASALNQIGQHDTANDTAPTDGSGGAARYSSGNPGLGIDINNATISNGGSLDFGITSFTATDGVTTPPPAPPSGLTAVPK